ncbi:MAG: hypothetical protein JO236_07525 [Mycobacterium sp.]|uniref:hypothetical protein n=1 Tax=Mycobacterium sp. TaxID=1785 RepID=UPI001ECC41F1|nr:hypothetical protein [Mycobacterium sp.]MBW0017378.1 hypothetical protein [Mycobacterium sp.]
MVDVEPSTPLPHRLDAHPDTGPSDRGGHLAPESPRLPGSLALRRCRRLRRAAPMGGVVAVLGVGAVLRLSFHGAIEWKRDEQWTYSHAQEMAGHAGSWPAIGMPSSIGPPNPGMSLWIFSGLFRLFGVHSPPDLAAAVQVMNVLALVAFAVFVLVAVPRARREPWLWALGLWAANPVAVILERKIWPPSVLPLPMVGILAAWWYRKHPAGAFAWGLVGALMTQVHMGVAFLVLALAVWTLVHDRGAFPWPGWLAGSVLGALPAIPWGLAVLGHRGGHAHLSAPSANFYGNWFTQFFGIGTQYTLGKHDFIDFLAGPRVGGFTTYALGAIEVVLVGVALVVLARAVRAALGTARPALGTILLGHSRETLLIASAFFGYGGVLTVITFSGADSYRHYLIVIVPIVALWTAMTVLWGDRGAARPWGRPILVVLVVLQAAMSFGLLAYINHKGVITGDFGTSWRL